MSTKNIEKEYVSIKDAAQIMGVSYKAIYNAIYRREIKGARRIGRIWRIPTKNLHP